MREKGAMACRRGRLVPSAIALLALFCFASFNIAVCAVKINTAQAAVLLDVVEKLHSVNSTFFKSWNVSNDCSKWIGVQCDELGNVITLAITPVDVTHPNGTVLIKATIPTDKDTGIVIPVADGFGNLLNGTISASITTLTSLQILSLRRNTLSGPIPADIGNLVNLKILDLQDNILEGNIPSSIGNLALLESLNIYDNQFTDGDVIKTAINGTVPSEIGNLVNLQYLNLGKCNFSGPPPPSLMNLINLVSLTLVENSFTGSVDSFLGEFSKLELLDLGTNKFTFGTFPAVIGGYQQLKTLKVVSCGLAGPMPEAFGSLPNLEVMDASDNQITQLPSDLSGLAKLKILNLAANNLTNIDPLSTLPSLSELELQENLLTGRFPDFSNFLDLTSLDINTNLLESNGIPEYFGNFTELTYLNMDSNFFAGEIPESLSKLTKLERLSCIQCGLTGSIPSGLAKMNLTYLDLSFNSLTGPIPFAARLLPLENLRMSSNQLNGTLYNAFISSDNIQEIMLDNNELTGNLSGVTPGPYLETLWVQSNRLVGGLPLPPIRDYGESPLELQIQDNKLTGSFPKKFFTGDWSYLDLSRNDFGGFTLPSDIGTGDATGNLAALRLRGCGLGGTIPASINKLAALQILDLSDNAFYGELPSLTNLTKLTELSLSNNFLRSASGSLSSVFADSPLQKLDLSQNRFILQEIPDLPKSYNTSLVTLNLENNSISGDLTATFLDRFPKLQAVFLKGNDLQGTVPIVDNHPSLEFVSLAGNDLSLAPGQEVNQTTFDLAGTPACTSNATLAGKPLCLGEFTPSSFKAQPFCNSITCAGDNLPSFYVFNQTGECKCSGYGEYTSVFYATPLSFISQKAIEKVQSWLLEQLQFFAVSDQLLVVSANISNGNLVSTVRVFGTDLREPNTQVQVSLQKLAVSASLIESLGDAVDGLGLPGPAVRTALVPLYVPPPPPPPTVGTSGGGSGKVQAWVIILIVVAGLLFVAVLILGAFVYQNRRRESKLTIRVQKHFVRNVDLADIKHATKNFSNDVLLGVGGYGSVYKGVTPNGEIWAVKRAKNISLKGLEEFETEVDVISKMSHTNIVKLLGFCDRKNEQILIYEFMSKGSLKAVLRPDDDKHANPPLTFEQRLDIAIGAAEGLRYLHNFAKPAVIHRDIKSDNILLDENLTAKVADFGLLKGNPKGSIEDAMNTRVAGTPGYIDPEYFTNFQVIAKSDVYSFGVVLFELITGRSALIKEETTTDPDIPNVTTLVNWVQPYLNNVSPIVDPRMGPFHDGAMRMLVKVAAVCTERAAKYRPNMDEVTRRLAQTKNVMLGIAETDVSSSHEDSDGSASFSSLPEGYINFSSTTKSNMLPPVSESYGGR